MRGLGLTTLRQCDLAAHGAKQAVSHLGFQGHGSTGIALVFSSAEVHRRQAGQLIHLLVEVRSAGAFLAGGKKLKFRKRLGVLYGRGVVKYLFELVASLQSFFPLGVVHGNRCWAC